MTLKITIFQIILYIKIFDLPFIYTTEYVADTSLIYSNVYNNATATVSNEMFEQKQCVWNFDCRSSTQCEENCRGCNRCNCGCALAFEFIIVETYEVAGVEGMSAWYLAGSLTSWRVVAGLLVGQSQFVHAYAAVTTIVIVLHRLKLMQWKGLLHAKCSKK